MRITDEKLEEVKAATDIVDVVGDYVQLKRAGGNFKGLCPFHNEKSPSFNVNPKLGIYKCFGCGVGGDAIAFVQQVESLGFLEAVRLLAERAGIELPEEGATDPAASVDEAALHALRFAARFYHRQLGTEEGRRRAVPYLQRRGFTAETVNNFGIGYAPESWDGLLKAAAAEPIKPETLEAAGLVLPRRQGDGHYDRFRGRLLFPILSHVGKVLGFGGRVLDGADKDQPKYINSPETAVYHKGRVLYGLYQAKQAIRGEGEVLLVEGYTDVISLHQAGVTNVVATSGTALTTDQVRALARYAKRVVLLFDADSAGAAAALRGIDLVLREGLPVYAVSLPEGADPDSFVQQFGEKAFREYLRKERVSFVEFQAAQARRSGALDSPEGQMETARTILSSIAQLPQDATHYVMWEGYLRQAAGLLGIPDIHLRRQFPDLVRAAGASAPPAPVPIDPAPLGGTPADEGHHEVRPEEDALLRLMLEHGTPMVELVLGHMGLEEFSAGPVREAVTHLIAQYEADALDPEAFTRGDFGEGVQRVAAGALVDRHTASTGNWERKYGIRVPGLNEEPFEAATGAMTLLKLDRIAEAARACQQRIYTAEQAGEDATPHVRQLQQLHELRAYVERRAFLTTT